MKSAARFRPVFAFKNKTIKTLIPAAAMCWVALTGCDGQDQDELDAPSAELVQDELDPADPFEIQEDEAQDGEFRSANVCHSACRKSFSSCLAGCSFIPRHGFQLARDERCLARCEAQRAECMAGCNKPNPGGGGGGGRITVQGPCFHFNATASGGLGGFRVYGAGEQKFHSFNPRTSNRICTGSGKRVRFELGKLLNPGIAVKVNVQGRDFNFPAGDRGDKFLNSWYRKFFDVYVK